MDVDQEPFEDPTPRKNDIHNKTPLKKEKAVSSDEKRFEQTEAKMEATEENVQAHDKIPLAAKKMKMKSDLEDFAGRFSITTEKEGTN